MKRIFFIAAVSSTLIAAIIACSKLSSSKVLQRPEGPCDVYQRGGAPCVAAHSTTRALYASYEGPLYQIMRASDGKKLDIGVVKATASDAGGYADAAAQDEFCKDTYCWITVLYDQSGKGNHLYQAPRGGFSGPAMGGYNNVPLADWAPVNVLGHKVYGVFIAPGMGLRCDDPSGTAVDDQAEGQYWVISGKHYNEGCCFDYGNAETDSRDDGDGTMETTYFGNQVGWYYGEDPGPWIMTDQENNLVGCVNDDPDDKFCEGLESVTWRFVTATADGEPHHWRTMGGDAQSGSLKVYYDGGRIRNERSSYDPMRKQGAILLGNGGDNSNGSAGTFYEAAMTAAGTFPTEELNQEVQANVVSARYRVAAVEVFPSLNGGRPSNVQSFVPGQATKTTVRFTNSSEEAIDGLVLKLDVPKGWKSSVQGKRQMSVPYSVEPGQTVVAEFDVVPGKAAWSGDLVAESQWKRGDAVENESARLKAHSTAPVKINEFSVSDGFIELFNASDEKVDISGWTLREHAIHIPAFSDIKIPSGTVLQPKSYYLLGMTGSGLAVPAAKGDKTIYVRSVEGINVGDEILVGYEKHSVAAVGVPQSQESAPKGPAARRFIPAGVPTTLWQPLPGGHGIEIPAGSTNIPVTSTAHFEVGQKMAIGYGTDRPSVSNSLEKYEVVTVTAVGKPGTQAYLAVDAKPGDTNIKVTSVENISVGDKIRLDVDSEGHGIETVTVTKVGTASSRGVARGPLKSDENPGTGLDIAEPLKYNHSSNMPFSVNGTGISFEPATKYPHYSNEPVLALCFSITLDKELSSSHPIDEAVSAGAGGYHGDVPADLLFGGPVLSEDGGSIVLRDSRGNIADALNYGRVVDPWIAEGYQVDAGRDQFGNYAAAPIHEAEYEPGEPEAEKSSLSSGRWPDGADMDDNKMDFHVQRSSNLVMPAAAGSINIKVSSVDGFSEGSPIVVGRGADAEILSVKEQGSAGATSLLSASLPGAKTITVVSARDFAKGQEITVGEERAVVSDIVSRRWWIPRYAQERDKITLASPLRRIHRADEPVTGTGITLSAPLQKAHADGSSVTSAQPTPGRANVY